MCSTIKVILMFMKCINTKKSTIKRIKKEYNCETLIYPPIEINYILKRTFYIDGCLLIYTNIIFFNLVIHFKI